MCYVEWSMGPKWALIAKANQALGHTRSKKSELSTLVGVCEAVWNTPFSFGGLPFQEVDRRVGEGPLWGLGKWWEA